MSDQNASDQKSPAPENSEPGPPLAEPARWRHWQATKAALREWIHIGRQELPKWWSLLCQHWQAFNIKAQAGVVAVVLLFGWWGCGSSNGLPKVASVEGEKPPSEVSDAVGELFEARFAKKGGNHFAIVAACRDDSAGLFSNLMAGSQTGKMPSISEMMGENLPPMLMRLHLIELRDLYTTVVAEPLSEADKLNDVQWKGAFEVSAKVERRRLLDLSPGLKAAFKDPNTNSIGWTLDAVKWSKATLASDDKKAKTETPKSNEDEETFHMFSFMEEIQDETWQAVLADYRGGDWGDWSDVEGGVYQRSYAVLRDGKITLNNEWEPEDVLPDGEHVNGFRMLQGFFGAMNADTWNESSNDHYFFMEPDMKALKKAGLFD